MPRRLRPLVLCLGLTVFGLSRPSAQRPEAPGRAGPGPGVRGAVKEWTTRPEFLTPLVDHLPTVARRADAEGSARLPRRRPRQADAAPPRRCATTARSKRRAARVKVLTIGKTDEGRELNIVVVAAEDDHP